MGLRAELLAIVSLSLMSQTLLRTSVFLLLTKKS